MMRVIASVLLSSMFVVYPANSQDKPKQSSQSAKPLGGPPIIYANSTPGPVLAKGGGGNYSLSSKSKLYGIANLEIELYNINDKKIGTIVFYLTGEKVECQSSVEWTKIGNRINIIQKEPATCLDYKRKWVTGIFSCTLKGKNGACQYNPNGYNQIRFLVKDEAS